MTIRNAGDADVEALRELWERFTDEAHFTPYPPVAFDPSFVRDYVALVAEHDGELVGVVYLNVSRPEFGFVFGLYVSPGARRRGVATALMKHAATVLQQRSVAHVVLDVDAGNAAALSLYRRLGFAEVGRRLAADVDSFLARVADARRPSYGSIHVQSDDLPAVERAVRQFVPRLPGASRGSVVSSPQNGWIAVYDEACDRDPNVLRRLARELSDRLGAVIVGLGIEEDAVVRLLLFDRGRLVDEYLSVQEYYGPLPPGDVVALAANPTVIARLTGADAAAVRAAALHARSPADLPPPADIAAGLARALGIGRAEQGYEAARELPDAVRIDR